MNIKLKLTIERHFEAIEEISKMIEAHNKGKLLLDLEVFEAFLLSKKAIYSAIYEKYYFELHTDTGIFEVFTEPNHELYFTIELNMYP